jgi:hypothetical protein
MRNDEVIELDARIIQQPPESGTWDVNASAMPHGGNVVFSQLAPYHRTLADPTSVRYAGEHHDLAAAIN